MPALIVAVEDESIADDIGITAGDTLISIDGREVNDILDYRFWTQTEEMEMQIMKANGSIWSVEIEKEYDDDLGLAFDDILFDRMKSCQNRCIFCFIDQLPGKMRKTLYVKDDDYRHSFLFGNFITLTNLSEQDWDKIETMRLSPLYISVHALQPEVRIRMLGNRKAGRIKQDLLRLSEAGIEYHTQIVVCPGINDGRILEETIAGLAELYPASASIGIVPVGLTGYRHQLPPLRTLDADEAWQLIQLVHRCQEKFRQNLGCGLVYLADEVYLKAGQPLPDADYYDDFPQLENGIGITRILLDEFAEEEKHLPDRVEPREVFLLTGESAVNILESIGDRLNQIQGLKLQIIPVKNKYFGGQVSVTGLLTGADILSALGDKYAGKTVIIPDIIFREGQDTLLDDISLEDIQRVSRARVRITEGKARSLVEAVLAEDPVTSPV